jgi:alkylation response protein AidB-like acyl-CoA dehydrogenase
VLLDLPPLDPKLPSSIEATVLGLCRELREGDADGERGVIASPGGLALLKGSGLLSLVVPAQFGGKGASWGTVLDIVRRVAKADSSIAERLASQSLQLGTIQLLGTPEQQGDLLFGTAHGDWLWGSAMHSASSQVRATAVPGGLEINGIPGGHVVTGEADRLLLSAQIADGSGTVIAAVDATRTGILRRAERAAATAAGDESARIEFRRLAVVSEELLGGVLTSVPVQATLRPLLEQLGLIYLFVGIAQGAFEDLVLANRGGRRLRLSGITDESDLAPVLLQRYADLWVDLKATSALMRSATRCFEDAWREGDSLGSAERARLALEIGEARLLASRAGMQLTQGVFEAISAGDRSARIRFDAWWRRLRAHSLNDPVDFKRREIGRWMLTGDLPRASLYS